MIRRRTAAFLAALALTVGLTAGTAAQASPSSDCRAAAGIAAGSTPTVTQLFKYDECRFDKQDAVLAQIKAGQGSIDTPPSATPSASPSATLSATPSPSATTSPAPTPTPTPSTTPVGASWRDAGVASGVTLKRVPQDVTSGTGWKSDANGNVTPTSGTAVLSGLLVQGRVDLNKATLTNVKVQCVGENDWCVSVGAGSTVTTTEIGGGADGTTFGHAIGVYTGGSDTAGNVFDRVLIHHQIHGMRVDGGTTVLNSYIRDLPMGDPVTHTGTGVTRTDDHTDGIMSTGWGNVTLRGTRIEGGNTAPLFIQNSGNPAIHDWLIEGCEFANVVRNGQVSSYGIGIDNRANTPGPFVIRNNTFTRGWQVGPINAEVPVTSTGNVYTDKTPL